MRKNISKLIQALLSFGIISCAPTRVKEHQLDGVAGRCGIGTNSIGIRYPDGLFRGGIELHKDTSSQKLVLKGFFEEASGKSIVISSEPIKLKFSDGKEYAAPLKLTKLDHHWTGVAVVDFEAYFPFVAMDLQIEFPKVKWGEDELPLKIIKYKFIDRIKFAALNGC